MNGSCACGKVTYRCGEPVQVVNCHCTLCRAINGSAFSSYVVVKTDAVELSGRDNLSTYMATGKATKHFCSDCGTPIFNANLASYPGVSMFYLGSVRDPAGYVPVINIFCRSKLDWVDTLSQQRGFSGVPHREA